MFADCVGERVAKYCNTLTSPRGFIRDDVNSVGDGVKEPIDTNYAIV